MRRPWYLRRWIVNAVTAVFLAGTLGPDIAYARAVSAVEAGVSYEDARERLAIAYRRLKQVRARMEASSFDPAALADTLGPETGDLFAFVRDRIAFQPYAGTLRFAAGTLMSRAGNACDQALLLGALLTARGQEVRYARARLDEASARRLLEAMNQPSPTATRAPLVPRAVGALGDVLAPLGVTVEDLEAERLATADATRWFLEELSRGFETDFPILARELEDAGYSLDDSVPAVAPVLLAEAADHCWVQMREGEAWLDLDPSLPSFAPGDRFRAAEELADALPATLMHRIEVRIELEQVTGDVRETRTVLAHDLALDSAVNDLTVMLVPEPSGGGMSASLANPDFMHGFGVVWPTLRFNGQTVNGDPFNLEGDSVPSDPELRAVANTGAVIGGLFGSALSGLTGEGAPAPEKARIGRIHATFTLVAPHGGRRLAVRRLVEGAGDEEALRRQILAGFDAVLSASRIDGSYLEARLLDHLLANRAYFFAILAESFGEPVPNLVDRFRRFDPFPGGHC